MTALSKTSATVTTREILLLQVHVFQVRRHASPGREQRAAQATHPLAVIDRCEAVLHSQCLVVAVCLQATAYDDQSFCWKR